MWADSVISELQAGRAASCRPRGNSMMPIVKSGQLCTIAPAAVHQVEVGDVVLCRVKGAQYLHLVKQVATDGRVLIGNNRGGTNGWTRAVYGRLIGLDGVGFGRRMG